MANEQGISYTSPSEAFWTIPDVDYRGEMGIYRLFKKMTPAMKQEQLAELYEQEKQKGNPHPTDAPLIWWGICTSAYTLKNQNPKEAERLRNFLQTGFQKYPNTLTRVIYNPSGEDKIIHNYKTSDQYSLNGKVVGPDGWINEIPDENTLEKLLGTSNIEQINKVSQWINNTDTHIWRLNSKPKTKNKRVARFVTCVDRFDLFCRGLLLDEYPAFRVLKVD